MLRVLFCSFLLLGASAAEITISLSQDDMTIVGNEAEDVVLELKIDEGTANFIYYCNLIEVQSKLSNNSKLSVNDTRNYTLTIRPKDSAFGHDTVEFFLATNNTNISSFLHVTIEHSEEWAVFSDVIGWIYFVAWSVSFYPQIYDNWKRKSVVGLNFDFLALNLFGFLMYSVFNGGLSWIESVRQEYFNAHPGGLIPVMINDDVFAFHAVFAVIITIIQCFIYERGDQSVSLPAKILLGIFFLFLLISLICVYATDLLWLDFLYFCSYVKLAITIIKYVPQAWMNYRRKSTLGWSIGNVLLDFTGGMLSMLQMIINSWNYDDWESIFGDPTKFGLGLFSVLFDIFFLIQHYILYRHSYGDFPESVVNSRSELVT